MSDLVAALSNARANYVLDDYARAVKRLIADHITSMEPEVQVEDTLYFNHSAIPDFVLTWGSQRRRRDLFVRASYASIMAADEPAQIRKDDPIFISLDSQQEFSEFDFTLTSRDLANATEDTRYTLLTDSSALSEIATPTVDANPLSSAIRSNFLKGARGFVDEPVAEALVSGGTSKEGLEIGNLIREKFSEDAILRVERTAALVQWALTGEAGQDVINSSLLQGKITLEELKNVLPWLLHQQTLIDNSEFWSRFGAMMSLEQLELLSEPLEGLDLTPLVRANTHKWVARRAYLGPNVKERSDVVLAPTWKFIDGMLSLSAHDRVVRVSHSGRKLVNRSGLSSSRWDEVKPSLEKYRLHSVSLSARTRSIKIKAREYNDINYDVAVLTDSVEDDYFVDKIEVNFPRVNNVDEDTTVEVNFSGSLASAPNGVSVSYITALVLNVIWFDQSVDKTDWWKVLDFDEPKES